jgi:hypothetical protein
MPIRYRIHPESLAVLTRCSDPVDLDQLRDYMLSLGADTAYREGLRELVDMRGVKRFDVAASSLATTIAVRTHRTAYIADDPLVLAKLEVYRDVGRQLPTEIALFNALGSAMAWAGVPGGCEVHFPVVEVRN